MEEVGREGVVDGVERGEVVGFAILGEEVKAGEALVTCSGL